MRKVIDDAARAVARGGKRLIRSVGADAQVGASPVRPRYKHWLPRLTEDRVACHSRCWIRANAVVAVHYPVFPAPHLPPNRDVEGVDAQTAPAARSIDRPH